MRAVRRWWIAGCCFLTLGVAAQTWRDPTLEPAAPASPTEAGAGHAETPLSVIVVDGRPRVIMGTRLYAPGQKLGQARIERITETEVWLREGAVLRKVPRYQGVERRTLPPRATPDCAAGGLPPAAPAPGAPLGVSCPKAQP